MKAFISVVVLVISYISIAQNKDSLLQSKIGIYRTFGEFRCGKPSVNKPFTVDTEYYILNVDTVITGYAYHFIDSAQIIKGAFGLYDGNHFYVMNKTGALERMDCSGKYIYRYYSSVSTAKIKAGDFIVAGFLGIAGRLIDGALFPQDIVIYLNKKGKFLEATPQAIGVLLRDDKDLLKEYEKEKKYNNDVYIKYLQKMNERYPL